MGWLFTMGQDRKSLIEHLTGESCSNGVVTHRRRIQGCLVWAVQSCPKAKDPDEKFIVLYRIGSDPGFGWGYKDIPETMGPYATGCPVEWFDEVPEPNDRHARDFRQRCHKADAEKKRIQAVLKASQPGDRLSTQGLQWPTEITLISKRPLMGSFDGLRYKLERRFIGELLSTS